MNPDIARLQRSARDAAQWRKAQEKLLSGRHDAALTEYRDLLKRFPRVAELWFETGNAAAGALDFQLANEAYRRARDLSPGNASMLALLGQRYQSLRQLDEARDCYEAAVAASPDSVDARINLAVWLEKDRRLDDAWDQVEACRAKHPGDDQVRYFRAFLLHRRKEFDQAERELRDLIAGGPRYPYVKYASRHLLGVVLDETGRYQEAVRWLLEAKAEVRTITDTAALERGYDDGERIRRELMAGLSTDAIRRWRDEAPVTDATARLAFLGGHPRSGTTLLEQILDANPALLAFDEPVAFSQEVVGSLGPVLRSGLGALDSLDARALTGLRDRYTRSLLREAPSGAGFQVLLDKNPSPTASLPVWLRVFPELKVVIALRDPRDVLISCFFLNITLNATNVNFLSIERTARHYADLMGVWLRMRELGGFDWIESRYEDVVADMEGEGRKVTSFLGLDWHGDQERFDETARRKVLYAPTYHDVTRKIYPGAVGRWTRYADVLEPVQAVLEPFCKALGY